MNVEPVPNIFDQGEELNADLRDRMVDLYKSGITAIS